MRVQVVEPQNIKECGICKAQNEWIKEVNVRGIKGIYCLKCDTLTMYNKMPSKYVYRAFKEETEKIRNTYLIRQSEK